jgi:hypothetical protein
MMGAMNTPSRNAALVELGHELRRLANSKDMTTREISSRMHGNDRLSHASIAKLLNGQTLPRLLLVLEVVRVLDGDPVRFQHLWVAAKNAKTADADYITDYIDPRADDFSSSEFRSLPELEAAHEDIQDKIRRSREREQEAHQEYYDRFEQRAEVEERIRDLEAQLAVERGDKANLRSQIQDLEAERARLTARIEELEVELSQTRATLLKLSEESDQINELRVECIYEWARAEEFKAITLERRLRGNG